MIQMQSAERELEQATVYLRTGPLRNLAHELSSLIYLASTRDYATGRYHHDGLGLRYGEETANEALACCHQEVFSRIILFSLEDLVQDVNAFIESSGEDRYQIVKNWKKLKPYSVLIPSDCDPLERELFISNFKFALAVAAGNPPCESPRTSQSSSQYP